MENFLCILIGFLDQVLRPPYAVEPLNYHEPFKLLNGNFPKDQTVSRENNIVS